MNFPRASATEPAWGHGGVMPSNAVWNTALLTVKFITFCLNPGLESKCLPSRIRLEQINSLMA